jgi:hypothetical protein
VLNIDADNFAFRIEIDNQPFRDLAGICTRLTEAGDEPLQGLAVN